MRLSLTKTLSYLAGTLFVVSLKTGLKSLILLHVFRWSCWKIVFSVLFLLKLTAPWFMGLLAVGVIFCVSLNMSVYGLACDYFLTFCPLVLDVLATAWYI